jgi:lysophospholipase L1-like esterase
MVKYAKELKEPDPKGEISHVHRTNASAELMGVEVKLNSLGHRGPELTQPKSPDIKRVFVLGSSVTMGWGVPLDKMFTSTVKERFDKERPLGPNVSIELANAGIGNYNTLAQSVLFNRQYPIVKPDLVVLHYFISDPEPRPAARNSPVLRYSMLAAYFFDRFRTLTLAAQGKTDLFKHYSDVYRDDAPNWRETLGYIGKMRDTAAADHVPFLIMIIPDFHNVAIGTPYAALYEKIDAGFKGLNIPTINTFPELQRRYGGHEQDLWIQPDDPHPNAKGHEVMADMLYDYLKKPEAFTYEVQAQRDPQLQP